MEVSGLDAAGLCGLTEELKMQLNGEIVEDIHEPIWNKPLLLLVNSPLMDFPSKPN